MKGSTVRVRASAPDKGPWLRGHSSFLQTDVGSVREHGSDEVSPRVPHTRCKVALTGRVDLAYPPRSTGIALTRGAAVQLGSGTIRLSGDAGSCCSCSFSGSRPAGATTSHQPPAPARARAPRPSPWPPPSVQLAGVKSFLGEHTDRLAGVHEGVQPARARYQELAEAEDFELEALWAARAEEVNAAPRPDESRLGRRQPLLRAGRGDRRRDAAHSRSTTSSSTRARARPKTPRARFPSTSRSPTARSSSSRAISST